jgi:hypothetical protein
MVFFLFPALCTGFSRPCAVIGATKGHTFPIWPLGFKKAIDYRDISKNIVAWPEF